MVGNALDRRAWDDAEGIVRALDAYWDTRGLCAEAAAWAERILAATADHDHASAGSARWLWIYTAVQQANRPRMPSSSTRPRGPASAPSTTCRASPI